ncbi:GTPase HflX [Natronogracilivirga saccharolytica]|uniref:GTPase HflX n=1 Tax=Natronogracilivirga saccharolytica TaxID=2812953 RepID=A0A8J7RGJ1_9BACT|nr:GTPase HflX [Natronogracilivirga saccharolytica]MBP3191470.1 GTPase HflX [Natronogracilivirga saccharolytica]
MNSDIQSNIESKERAVLVGIYGDTIDKRQAEEYITELELLADTAGGVTVDKILQHKPRPDVSTYIGKGKLREVRQKMKEASADLVIFDDDLSPTQARNIEKATESKVLDRSGLILDIFASRAKTSAAKTQVELAQLQYLLPRLTRYWTHLSRQKGGIGTKGPGETQIETDRRLIGRRISVLKEKLEKLDNQRKVQRKGRKDALRVALVGYTNAGKSSLMNAMTDTSVFAENRLFATLDATVRRLQIDQEEVLLSDTVGFIRKLPHNLVESFKSTLDEIREADILLHVVDVASPVKNDYIETVNKTLEELEVHKKPVILVFNKVDLLESPQDMADVKHQYPGAVMVSAYRGIGLDDISREIKKRVESNYLYRKIVLPIQNYHVVSFLHEVAEVEEESYDEDSIVITCRIHEKYSGRLDELLRKNNASGTDLQGANGENHADPGNYQ